VRGRRSGRPGGSSSHGSARGAAVHVCLALLAAAGCRAPSGEVLVFADTDLPVPQIINRLRVDLYAPDGTWFDSRDFDLPNPSDWPASFAITNDDPVNDRQVLVRMRAYPLGHDREYQGERFADRPTFTEPPVANSLAELCGNPPALELGKPLTLRRGPKPLLDGSCGYQPSGGSLAASVEIPAPGRYTLGVVHMVPTQDVANVEVRSSCERATTALACSVGRAGENPTVTVAVDGSPDEFPRRLFLLVSGQEDREGSCDVTIAAAAEAEWANVPYPVPQPGPPAGSGLPTLAGASTDSGISDSRPAREPEPDVTIDRLALVRVAAAQRGSVFVTLRGGCTGTMARMNASPETRFTPVLAEAATCVDREAQREPLSEEPLRGEAERPPPSLRGTFGGGGPCGPADSSDEVACIPGGVFLFGGSSKRLAVMSRFYLDRHEVLVSDWRVARGEGLGLVPYPGQPQGYGPVRNDGPIQPGTWQEACSFSKLEKGREDFGLSCVLWSDARHYCQARGGDLPTEAQFEYAAGWSSRPLPTAFPWGNGLPRCAAVVFGVSYGNDDYSQACAVGTLGESAFQPLGPRAAAVPPTPHNPDVQDVSPDGVYGLSGGLNEWARDSFEPVGGDCLRSQPLKDPACIEVNPPRRSTRGGSWWMGIVELAATERSSAQSMDEWDQRVGFRCAYDHRPAP